MNICCLFGKKLDNDELFSYLKLTSRFLKKKLPKSIKPTKKKKMILRSTDFNEILSNNHLTNQTRSSRRKPNANSEQNSLFCGKQGDRGDISFH